MPCQAYADRVCLSCAMHRLDLVKNPEAQTAWQRHLGTGEPGPDDLLTGSAGVSSFLRVHLLARFCAGNTNVAKESYLGTPLTFAYVRVLFQLLFCWQCQQRETSRQNPTAGHCHSQPSWPFKADLHT